MKTPVSAIVIKYHQIFNMIIKSVLIYMMHPFFSLKVSSKMFLHYKPMFKNISMVKGVWMVRLINTNISFVYCSSAFPCRRYLPVPSFHWVFFVLPHMFSFIPSRFPDIKSELAFYRTIFSFITFIGEKNFVTKFTIMFCQIVHSILLKIKALFRYLREQRLSYSTLLSADFRHRKTVSLLDRFSITDFGILSI